MSLRDCRAAAACVERRSALAQDVCHFRATARRQKRSAAIGAAPAALTAPKSLRQSSGLHAGAPRFLIESQLLRRGGCILPSPVEAPDAALDPPRGQPQLASLRWALRRAALWLALVVVMAVLGAWLFYASVDTDEASAAGAPLATDATAPR